MSIGDEATAGLRFMEDEAKAWTVGHKLWLIFAALIAVAAFVVWTQWPAKPIPEITTAAPDVHQVDGSVIAERRPDPKPPAPRHVLPKGAVEERRAQVVVAPASAASSVEVDLSLVRMPDNGRRVIASSPDGQIVSALDIPIEAGLVPPEPKKWAAGLAYSTQRDVGVWLERDVGRLRMGAEVSKGAGAPRAELRVGVTF